MTQMKFPHWFFWRPRPVVLPNVPFLDLCISSWAKVFGTKHYLGDNVSLVCHHPRRHRRICGQDTVLSNWANIFLSQWPWPAGFSTRGRPWLESSSPFGVESGDLRILPFFYLKSSIHLCFLVFYKEELCLCFSSPGSSHLCIGLSV